MAGNKFRLLTMPIVEMRDGYFIAAEKWLENEMWNQRDRRPPDLHDLAAFAQAYRQGFTDGYRRATAEDLHKESQII